MILVLLHKSVLDCTCMRIDIPHNYRIAHVHLSFVHKYIMCICGMCTYMYMIFTLHVNKGIHFWRDQASPPPPLAPTHCMYTHTCRHGTDSILYR